MLLPLSNDGVLLAVSISEEEAFPPPTAFTHQPRLNIFPFILITFSVLFYERKQRDI